MKLNLLPSIKSSGNVQLRKTLSIVIIEDDPITAEILCNSLKAIDEDVEVITTITSVYEGINYFRSKPEVDLIFSEVQLKDGLSFTILKQTDVQCPIIFISMYDNYMVKAFEYSGIDYLLKPIGTQELKQAIDKYRLLQQHFLSKNKLVKEFVYNYTSRKRTRLIVKKGYNFISLLLEDIVLFYTENLIVFVVDNCGNKYIIDKNLNTLEEELDNKIFFRANRQYIINVNYIQGFKSHDRVKLQISLKKDLNHLIIIGQEKAKAFRKWITEE